MKGLELIEKYFPGLTQTQLSRFEMMGNLYPEWNSKINVISRKDIENIYENHILHSLSIALFLGEVSEKTRFMDLGTGGGFPGLPLAVIYPDCHFHLIDRIAKKLRVASDIAEKLGLKNVTFQHGDAGECHRQFNYVVSRAVMPLNDLVGICRKHIEKKSIPENRYSNGIICLKGGDLTEETKGIRNPVIEFPLNEFFAEAFYNTKKLIYVPV